MTRRYRGPMLSPAQRLELAAQPEQECAKRAAREVASWPKWKRVAAQVDASEVRNARQNTAYMSDRVDALAYIQHKLAWAGNIPLPRPSLLPDRPLTPEERAAHDEDPRPGAWAGQIGRYYGAEEQGDLRALTQEQTNYLIRLELIAEHSGSDRLEIDRAIGPLRFPQGNDWSMTNQRGGIDSDPLVRLLAFRAWGDRDRSWFELRGVRKGEVVVFVSTGNPLAYVALRYEDEMRSGTAMNDARPGEMVAVEPPSTWNIAVKATPFRVSDRLRVDPSQPAASRIPSVEFARLHFLAQGVPADQLWCALGSEPGVTYLWHSPAGFSAPEEERQLLARTWIEDGERRYEGPEVDDLSRYRSPVDDGLPVWQHRPDTRQRDHRDLDFRYQFDFDECEIWDDQMRRTRTIRATREGRTAESMVTHLYLAAAPYGIDPMTDAASRISELLGPRTMRGR